LARCAVGECQDEGPAQVDDLFMCPAHFAEFLTKYCESCGPWTSDPYQPPFAAVLGRRIKHNDFPVEKVPVIKAAKKGTT